MKIYIGVVWTWEGPEMHAKGLVKWPLVGSAFGLG